MHYILKHVAPNENFRLQLGSIQIGDNVFVGAKLIIFPNVKIGSNVIVGGGSFVLRDIPDGKIVAGNPAKGIGSFEDLLNKRKVDVLKCEIRHNAMKKNGWLSTGVIRKIGRKS